MYGKVMSISDEMMWRYYELLTDVQVADIERMKREAHPMQAKKDLASRIVKDFHSGEAAEKAAEDWAKQFQKGGMPDTVEEILIKLSDVEWSIGEDSGMNIAGDQQPGLRVDRLLVKCGLADSGTDATRKIKSGAVRIGEQVIEQPRVGLKLPPTGPARLPIKVGRLLKIAVIQY
jgi:tyrosyl-tRNA synthetase